VGFRVIDVLAERHRFPQPQLMPDAITGRGKIGGDQVLIAKPTTFMNEGGRAVARICRGLDISPEDVLVICDDLNLDLGTLRLRRGGSAGGHKGLASIIEHCGIDEFPRLRLGIGRLPPDADGRSFVLAPFDPDEETPAEEMIARAADAVECVLEAGLETAMNRFNGEWLVDSG
jgi:PTH1 family peptidyl-tRNA hydrolase